MPRVVPEHVFDAWSWCESDWVEWRTPGERAIDLAPSVELTNPSDLAFVMHAECTFLPRELATLHAPGYGFTGEWALAPYAIDDATDLLYETRTRPRDVLWIAAASLPALVWGLHDWVHFHNHGPFEDQVATELQCDTTALAWLRLNAGAIGIDARTLARVEAEVRALNDRRSASSRTSTPRTAGPGPDATGT